MGGIKDFFNKKKSDPDSTQVGGSGGESTQVGSSTYVEGLHTKFSRLSDFNSRIPFEGLIPYILVMLLALMGADLASIAFRAKMIPKPGAAGKRQTFETQAPYRSLSDYSDVLARNIFNSDGFIPDVQIAGAPALDMNTARESSLPLTLVGTIVHANPGKSVATVQLKGNAEKVLPYIPNDDIEGMATLIKVERKKAFIRNLSAGSIEYIQIKDDSAFTFQKKTVSQDGPISKENDSTFAISRTDLETQMSNLPELLTQARAVPNLVPGGNGKIDGFRILDVVEGSLYTKLGIKTGDVIKGVDGEPLDSPAKAMELYNSLRSKNQVQLTMERNGKSTTMTYNIR